MNKHESKYFNTARLMDESLMIMLSKKDFELITVKDICDKAGVNRSTFYLHYENMLDLLKECIEQSNKNFLEKFKKIDKDKIDINTRELDDLVLINDEYLVPYLEFVKENMYLFRAVHSNPELFNKEKAYGFMYDNVFNPILKRFGFTDEDNRYIMEYYANGTSSIILKWASGGCKESIEKIVEIIMLCIRPEICNKNDNYK